jgi:hypothetical protein
MCINLNHNNDGRNSNPFSMEIERKLVSMSKCEKSEILHLQTIYECKNIHRLVVKIDDDGFSNFVLVIVIQILSDFVVTNIGKIMNCACEMRLFP